MRALAVCVLLTCLLAAPVAGQEAIQRVDTQVVYDGPPPHPVVRERILAAVAGVADRLLLGRSLDAARLLQPRLAETFVAVLERVITGYAVASATADIGPVTAVVIRLSPSGAVIEAPAVHVDLRQVPERLHPLVGGLLQPAQAQLRLLPAGLPADAAWAFPLLEEQARTIIEGELVGYTASVAFAPAPAVLTAAIRPADSRVIRDVGVRFRSSTLPNLLMEQHAPAVTSLSAFLRGVPVAFATAHTGALERIVAEDLAAYPPVRQYHVVATVSLQVGETTFVTVVADSVSYRASVEAQLNIGVGAPGPSLVGRAGRFFAPGLDAFVEVRLIPNTLSLDWDLGAGVSLGPDASVGVSYTVPTSAVSVWTSVDLAPDLSLRGTWNTTAQTFEAAVRYRLNAFLAWEVVGVPGRVWVRLVSNL